MSTQATTQVEMTGARPRRLLRSIGAVFAGLIAVFILSLGTDQVLHVLKIYPPWGQSMSDVLFLVATVYRLLYCIAGSYLAARLAPDRPMRHALALGVLGLMLSILGAAATWSHLPPLGPHWYPVALVVTALPCAWVGGKLWDVQAAARSSAQPNS
jgi:hypothetical protein